MDGMVIFWSFDLNQNTENSEMEEMLKAHESQINAILFNNKHFFTASK